MLNLDPAKLLVILVVALVVLGPERLPRFARQVGGILRELNKVRDQVSAEIRDAVPDLDLPHIPSPSSAVAGFLGNLRDPLRAGTATAPGALAEEHPGETPVSAEADHDVPDVSFRRAPRVVMHPGLSDGAFLPDDPSMN